MREYRVVPLIFPKKNFDIGKVMRKMNYPLNLFSNHEYRKIQQNYKNPPGKMIDLIERWDEFVPIHSLIENVFKSRHTMGVPVRKMLCIFRAAKDAFSLQYLHRYSAVSVIKFVAINALLVGMTILSGVNQKKVIRRMAE